MIATDFISYEIPELKPTYTIGKALSFFEELRLDCLPYVVDKNYEGILTEDYLLGFNDNDLLETVMPDKNKVYFNEDNHLFEMMDMLPNCNQTVVAVVDSENRYKGAAKFFDIVKAFVIDLGRTEQGAILEIAIQNKDYSLSAISSIIEAEKVKIVSSYVSGLMPGLNSPLKVTLKLNKKDIANVLASLKRYNYQVEAYFSSEPISSLEKDRYSQLMKYLDI